MDTMRKDFGINGVSDVAVEYNGYMVSFLVATPDGEGMMAVTYSEFMEAFKALAYVALTSWNTDLANEYRDFDRAVKNMINYRHW